ncbi:hypothetical protein CAPTEDRAFT_167281 [Capitella teleta]|uniref:Uncharacterized protein n=1 Tax=Capitella teleta TaxID=283909 RepID=R7UIH5_CAPTE|nr:hypothetical protein CAPTEDRAFT_167281 [Capitella teleta]|eukprot:ELU03062.1 hypothetical protein CAPTEDRAFT_167281 [Capitella teleta]
MAVAVDSFQFLLKETLSLFSKVRDTLAIVGALYAARRTLALSWRMYKAFKAHGLSRLTYQSHLCYYGSWAVVTGSTHGIGRAYAQELAASGLNIVIVSLGQEDCQLVADDLERTFGIETCVVAVDFDGCRDAYAEIKKSIEDKDIGILVNNVGVMYDYPQYFLDVPEQKLWQLFHVNVAAATVMTHIVLPQMVEKGRGAVVTVASGATSSLPTPQMTVYSATKAYLDYFMRALSYEYSASGVAFQCLQPFYVATRMTSYSATLSSPSLFIPSATTYARNALMTLGWSQRTTGYWPHTIQFWLTSLMPEWLWLWGSSRLNAALRRQAHQRIRHTSGGSRPSSQIFPSSASMDHFLSSPGRSLEVLSGGQLRSKAVDVQEAASQAMEEIEHRATNT